MWRHFVNLLSQSGQTFLSALGTTGLGWWVQGIVWFVATEGVTFLVVLIVRGKAAMKEHIAGDFKIGLYVWIIVMICVYGPIFGWHVVKAIFDDHETLVADVKQLENAPRPICPVCPTCIPNKPCPVPKQQPQQCWAETIRADTSAKQTQTYGAKSTVIIMAHCNYRLEPPIQFGVELDTDKIQCGAFEVPLVNAVIGTGPAPNGKEGKNCSGQINNPPVPADRLVLMRVYGTQDAAIWPRPLHIQLGAMK